MFEALLGLLSVILPLALELISDKMSDTSKREEPVSDLKDLKSASCATDVAVSFARHDQRVRRLLLKADAQKRKRSRS